jgi:hypothetical protein
MIRHAIRDGLSRVRAVWGLVLFLLLVNVAVAAVLALPLFHVLEGEFEKGGTAGAMMYGFDVSWWGRWAEANPQWSFGPDMLGTGFAFKNLDLLLRGNLPAGLFVLGDPERPEEVRAALDPLILGLGVVYLVVQVFLAGGILGALRAPRPTWTVRGLLHGSGFYFGRFFRLGVLVLIAAGAVFWAYAPFARWVDDRAREAVSERTALAWLLGRNALLLLALLALNMLASYARVIIVLEERASALLAVLSSAAFCAANLRRTLGHVLAMAALGVALLAAWSVLDRHWHTVGYKTQIVTVALLEGLVFARLFLRLSLLGGQVFLYRRLSEEAAPAA